MKTAPKACERAVLVAGGQTAPCVKASRHEGDCMPSALYTKFPPSLVETWTLDDAIDWLSAEVGVASRANREMQQAVISEATWRSRAEALACIVRALPKRPKAKHVLVDRAVDWAADLHGAMDLTPRPSWASESAVPR